MPIIIIFFTIYVYPIAPLHFTFCGFWHDRGETCKLVFSTCMREAHMRCNLMLRESWSPVSVQGSFDQLPVVVTVSYDKIITVHKETISAHIEFVMLVHRLSLLRLHKYQFVTCTVTSPKSTFWTLVFKDLQLEV